MDGLRHTHGGVEQGIDGVSRLKSRVETLFQLQIGFPGDRDAGQDLDLMGNLRGSPPFGQQAFELLAVGLKITVPTLDHHRTGKREGGEIAVGSGRQGVGIELTGQRLAAPAKLAVQRAEGFRGEIDASAVRPAAGGGGLVGEHDQRSVAFTLDGGSGLAGQDVGLGGGLHPDVPRVAAAAATRVALEGLVFGQMESGAQGRRSSSRRMTTGVSSRVLRRSSALAKVSCSR